MRIKLLYTRIRYKFEDYNIHFTIHTYNLILHGVNKSVGCNLPAGWTLQKMCDLLCSSVSNRHYAHFRSSEKHFCLCALGVASDMYFLYSGIKFRTVLCVAEAEAPQFCCGKVTMAAVSV